MDCIIFIVPMNPCPCGYYPDRNRCTCTQQEIHRYLHRISQPLLDRMDICVEASSVSWQEMTEGHCGQNSEEIRAVVTRVQEMQRERYQGSRIRFNSDLEAGDMERYCPMVPQAKKLMRKAYTGLALSARGYHRILKVARTIADMDGQWEIGEGHISEALTYRMLEKKYWR